METREMTLLRIFISETEKMGGSPAFEAIVSMAKEEGIGGVTVLKGIMGYGSHRSIHSSKILDLSTDLPVIIEAVDSSEAIDKFVGKLEKILTSGTITMENVRVMTFKEQTPDR
ncbi:MAG: DUF190 domain-containing protein [Ignavibacteria bacterium]|nr:DUF190 domain-containing protein [Ignavibacteria bacterium]